MSTVFRLAELGLLLDVRPAIAFAENPTKDSVNIPFSELSQRLHELPSVDESLAIADNCGDATMAIEFLRRGGRNCQFSNEFEFLANEAYEPRRLWRPNSFLEKIAPDLQKGRALDLGCGSGRDSVFLAGNGFDVLGVDILPDALEKGRDLASRYLIGPQNAEPPIEWRKRDLEKDGPPDGPYDLIVSFRYLHRPLLEKVHELLNKGGSLVLETFTELHREKHGKPSSDDHVLKTDELAKLAPGLEVRIADEGWRGDIHTGRLLAVKT